jgi:4-diphosphocytidyl-2C-methyl-D-erythritol kinase
MEGRGERIKELETPLRKGLKGREVLLFKPRFSINTAEAYRRLAQGGYYQDAALVESLLVDWRETRAMLPAPCKDFDRLTEDGLPSLAVVLNRLRQHGLDARMSGSGSACFVMNEQPGTESLLREELVKAWGPYYWLVPATLQ